MGLFGSQRRERATVQSQLGGFTLPSRAFLFVAAAAFLVLLGLVGPRIFAVYDFLTANGRFYRLLNEQLGFGSNESQLLSTVFSLTTLFASAYVYSWSFLKVLAGGSDFRGFLQGASAFVIVSCLPQVITLATESAFGEACFVQGTGQPRKWYTIDSDGRIILSDAGGLDDRGRKREMITVQTCQAYFDQKSGRYPKLVTYTPDVTVFFDALTGAPKLWYSVRQGSEIVLFDRPGVDPVTRKLTRSVTEQIESILRKRAQSIQVDSIY